MTVTITKGDCLEVLPRLPADLFHTCITSPPYWGMRDYETPGGIGSEEDPDDHLNAIVQVCREVKRTLRPGGTLWLNYGDLWCSIGHKKSNNGYGSTTLSGGNAQIHRPLGKENDARSWGLKHKDFILMGERIVMALQQDGWWLRHRIVWHKPNPMPESVKDRPTNAAEMIWLLSRSSRYYYDHEAVRTPPRHPDRRFRRNERPGLRGKDRERGVMASGRKTSPRPMDGQTKAEQQAQGANLRSVWTVATRPFPGPHFASFPPDLIVPCILAGCPEGGIVLDPFGGAGTVGLVAARLRRHAYLIEQNPKYAALAANRIEADVRQLRVAVDPAFNTVHVQGDRSVAVHV